MLCEYAALRGARPAYPQARTFYSKISFLFFKCANRNCSLFLNEISSFQATAISVGIHVNLVGRLFACLRDLEAAAGEKLSRSLQVKNSVEVDATSVRTVRIGKNS